MPTISASRRPIKSGVGPCSLGSHICLDRNKPNKTGHASRLSRLSRSRAYRQIKARVGGDTGKTKSQIHSNFVISIDCLDTLDQAPIYTGFLRSRQIYLPGLPRRSRQ
jgi:hypothetical protein